MEKSVTRGYFLHLSAPMKTLFVNYHYYGCFFLGSKKELEFSDINVHNMSKVILDVKPGKVDTIEIFTVQTL